MKRLLLVCLCTSIVAAFQMRLAAAVAVSEDVPVPGGTAVLAQTLGLEALPDRSRFVSELVRLVYDIAEPRSSTLPALLAQLGASPDGTESEDDFVPVPLTAAVWSEAIFRRPIAGPALLTAILGDRHAALICRGLAALDDPTLQFLAEHPLVLSRLYEHAAAAFAAFGNSLRVRDGRVVTPGGDRATSLWESVVGERVTRPDRFVRGLFEHSDGRLAYLYDTVAQLDEPRAAFVLGLWMDDANERLDRFRTLVGENSGAYHEWQVKLVPFVRPMHDLAMLLLRMHVQPNGAPSMPASRALWSRIFDSEDVPDEPPGSLRNMNSDDFIDAAWLAQALLSGGLTERAERLDQFAFGQRVFGEAPWSSRGDLFIAIRGFARYRMLMLTLERLSVTSPATYANAARRANVLAELEPARAATALAQFQGALALLTRMHASTILDAGVTESLVASLTALPLTADGYYGGGVVRWLEQDLRRAIPPADDFESAIVSALGGARPGGTGTHVTWEGQDYRLDVAAAEAARLRRVREKQGGYSADVPLTIEHVAEALTAETLRLQDIDSAVATLKALDAPPVAKAVQELSRITQAKDVRKAARIATSLREAGDLVLAHVLLSFSYAADIGDPEGTALLAGNVALRHDLGGEVKDHRLRAKAAWAQPRQEVSPGAPWHIKGSVVGLDLALAPLALRRIETDRIAPAPSLTSTQRDMFAMSVSMMNPFALHDADRDAIVDAIARGRQHVEALTDEAGEVEKLVDRIGMDGWRRRALRWSLAHDRGAAAELFSLAELLELGGGATQANLDAWSMAGVDTFGCACMRFTPARWWVLLVGRPRLGSIASVVSDLNFHIGIMLKELGLPAALAKSVLEAAMQDFIDQARPSDPNDWLTLVRWARTPTRERIEDYIAAVTADGALVPEMPPQP